MKFIFYIFVYKLMEDRRGEQYESSKPVDNKEVISVKVRFFNFFGKEIRGVIE
jgi:hypothetical protein